MINVLENGFILLMEEKICFHLNKIVSVRNVGCFSVNLFINKIRLFNIKIAYNDFFSLIYFKHKRVGEKVGKKVGEKNNVNSNVLITLMRNSQIFMVKISRRMVLLLKNIEVNIKKFKCKGILNRIMSAKGGYWSILK